MIKIFSRDFIIRYPVICKKLMQAWDIKKEIFQIRNIWQNIVFLFPMYAELTDEDVDYVIETLNSY